MSDYLYSLSTSEEGIRLIQLAVVNLLRSIAEGDVRYEDSDTKEEVKQDLKNLLANLDVLLSE